MGWLLAVVFFSLYVHVLTDSRRKLKQVEEKRILSDTQHQLRTENYKALQSSHAAETETSKLRIAELERNLVTLRREKSLSDEQIRLEVERYESSQVEHAAVVVELERELENLRRDFEGIQEAFRPYHGLLDIDAQYAKVERALNEKQNAARDLDLRIARLQKEVDPLDLESIARDFGLYEPKYDFGTSALYKHELERVRKAQKELIRQGDAVKSPAAWTINGNEALGRKMLKEIAQLQARAFNGESEALIQKVRFDNVLKIESRLVELWKKINVLDGETGSHLTLPFLELKLQELRLVHEYHEKRQIEAEEQRAIREQMREEERAQKELDRALADAEREEQRYEVALERARRDVESAVGTQQERLQSEIARLSEALAEAHARSERAISMAQQTRVGHVYVISNIGSFGENVYKIGMTRRLEPLERVRELGNASVPFNFDVHAVIYSEDAPKLEADLHREFAARRVNQVNPRKEFFHITLEEIAGFVQRHHGQIEFTMAAEAADYRKTRAMTA
ncbi:DUF4041 domain-containing protein [Deinococcus sp. 6GRE01]|uniref:DUF4041 domain-containing protein n=1 Tax=Deinococcus sp. 6GRE01 TaxID=2745873 RepID=UPI001E511927|nr:DUF4041 domain-containing protein [Deinococcus sp. 6GRE01]MCD0157776.1 DUF4041 domain-containing protein [Deinococcus sp. 6GRE01]